MKVLNFGSLNIDFVYSLDHFVRKGETISSESLDIFSGGKGLNQSIAMGRAGISVFHAGAIGPDGQFLLDIMREASVNTELVKKLNNVRTGNAVIQKDKSGDNCIILYGGANLAITKEQIEQTLGNFHKGDFIILQNEINEMGYLIESAYNKGMVIVFNPSPMNKTVMDMPLDYVSYFVLNEIEAGQILEISEAAVKEVEVLAAALAEKFPHARIVLTLGDNGSVYAGDGMTHRQSVYPVKAVDTTAAGDTFTGYLIAGIINGVSIERAMDLAAKAAAITVSGAGAASSIPTMEQVKNWGF